MASKAALSPADRKLWSAFSQDITPLPGKTPPAALPAAGPAPTTPPAAPPAVPPSLPPQLPLQAAQLLKHPHTLPDLHTGAAPAGVDKSTWRKFAAGKIRAARRLDLHGHTAARGHRAVLHFIASAHAAQLRDVEIITGNGEVLARELPHWLNSPALRPLILAIAHPHPANTGSLRVLLRRHRPGGKTDAVRR